MVSRRRSASALYRCLFFLARYDFRALSQATRGPWRWIYVIGAVTCLYFNLFVAVVAVL